MIKIIVSCSPSYKVHIFRYIQTRGKGREEEGEKGEKWEMRGGRKGRRKLRDDEGGELKKSRRKLAMGTGPFD